MDFGGLEGVWCSCSANPAIGQLFGIGRQSGCKQPFSLSWP